MCGLAGLVCLGGTCPEESHRRLVRRLCDLQAHRGPDHTGVQSLGPVCLGANRLSIIDLSPAAHMPLATEDGRWWISYNGEVYNFQPLREELTGRGHVFRSRSDTEVVLRAFAQWGESCLDRFVGMFAFAVYDRETDRLVLARDRFGKKPLYHATRDGHILFASELKALLCVSDGLRVNQARLIEWWLYREVDPGSRETLVEDVYSLPAGHLLRITGGQPDPPRCYYSTTAQVDAAAYDRLARAPDRVVLGEVESRLVAAVRDRLVSDVPLGTLLSGGIDSSLITALAARERPGLVGFNVSVEGRAALDESRYARAVARTVGVELRVYPLTAEAYRRALVRAVYHSDAPLTHPNSVAFLLVSQLARASGVTTLLSGEGADELFGGYRQRYRRYRQLLRVRSLLERAPARVRTALALVGATASGLPVTRFGEYGGLLRHTIAVLDRYARDALHLRGADAYRFVASESERAVLAAMLADLSLFLPPLLQRLDRMSMAASVECRTPFLDHRLVSLVVNLPLAYRLRGRVDKWIVKEIAQRYLPRSIAYRKKVGFPLPLREYLAPLARLGTFRGGFCETVLGLHPRGLAAAVSGWSDNVDGFFSLLTLEIWGRLFFLREPLDEVAERVLGAEAAPEILAGADAPVPSRDMP
jgi:asparagine synthase (glutamine-hydrolysing)